MNDNAVNALAALDRANITDVRDETVRTSLATARVLAILAPADAVKSVAAAIESAGDR